MMIDEQLGHQEDGIIFRIVAAIYLLAFVAFLVLFVLCVSQGPMERPSDHNAKAQHAREQ